MCCNSNHNNGADLSRRFYELSRLILSLLYLLRAWEPGALYSRCVNLSVRSVGLASRTDLSKEDHELREAFGPIHDIGKAPSLATNGFHLLDGAESIAARKDVDLSRTTLEPNTKQRCYSRRASTLKGVNWFQIS